MVTLDELKQRLAAKYDPNDLLELLKLDSTDLVDRFGDLIEERQDELRKELEEDDEFSPYSSTTD